MSWDFAALCKREILAFRGSIAFTLQRRPVEMRRFLGSKFIWTAKDVFGTLPPRNFRTRVLRTSPAKKRGVTPMMNKNYWRAQYSWWLHWPVAGFRPRVSACGRLPRNPARPKPSIAKRPAKPEPSVVDKMAGGVKSSWNSTTKLLTPGKKKAATTTKKPGFSTTHKKPAPDKWSLGGVFGTKKAEPPRGVTEWMSQPRLDP